jgi:hypothetical protein
LFRHYWVAVKLATTGLITAVLVVHLQPIDVLASAAAKTTVFIADLRGLRIQMVAYAIAALLVLLVLTVLSVYKPHGVTRYGWRRQQEARAPSQQ